MVLNPLESKIDGMSVKPEQQKPKTPDYRLGPEYTVHDLVEYVNQARGQVLKALEDLDITGHSTLDKLLEVGGEKFQKEQLVNALDRLREVASIIESIKRNIPV